MQDKKFIENFEKKVKGTIRKYRLLEKKDRIIVACSGGKDSVSLLYLLKKFGYDIEAMIIDFSVGKWSEKNLENTREFCRAHKIKLHVINVKDELGHPMEEIRKKLRKKTSLQNCAICGVIKRWALNRKARQLGASKIATGHNLDDEAETIFMNILKANPALSAGLGPKTGIIEDKRFVPRVKPLYLTRNREIEKYAKLMKFQVLYEPCPLSSAVFRRDILNALDKLEKELPEVKEKIVRNYLRTKPMLEKKYSSKETRIKYCKICSEPSRGEICRTCELLKIAGVVK